ncbi:MAG: hypothetical protein V4805_10695 [Pseudomonadota bacterium]
MHSPITTQHFEYRSATKHHAVDPLKKRIFWLSLLALTVIAAVMAIHILQLAGIANWNDLQQHFLPKSSTAVSASHVDSSAHRAVESALVEQQGTNARLRGNFLPLSIYLLIACALVWLEKAASKRSALALTDQTLSRHFQLPFNLNTAFPLSWQIGLHDITSAELILPTMFGAIPVPAKVRLRVHHRGGPAQTLFPAMWFVPGSQPRPRLMPSETPSLFANPFRLWRRPENQAIAHAALTDFPLVHALRAHGIGVSESHSHIASQNLFASRSVKLGLLVALGLVIATIGLMIVRKNQHLQYDFPRWLDLSVGTAAFIAFWLMSHRDTPPALTSTRAFGALCFAVGVAVSAQQIVLLVNGLGLGAEQAQTFEVRGGNLQALPSQSAIGTIVLAGNHGRAPWLQDGTKLTLTVQRGRLGLWEFDDAPLRRLPDR